MVFSMGDRRKPIRKNIKVVVWKEKRQHLPPQHLRLNIPTFVPRYIPVSFLEHAFLHSTSIYSCYFSNGYAGQPHLSGYHL